MKCILETGFAFMEHIAFKTNFALQIAWKKMWVNTTLEIPPCKTNVFYYCAHITSVTYYFSKSFQQTLVNVCWQQRLPWTGLHTWSAMSSFDHVSTDANDRKKNVIFCPWPTGKAGINDVGNVDGFPYSQNGVCLCVCSTLYLRISEIKLC